MTDRPRDPRLEGPIRPPWVFGWGDEIPERWRVVKGEEACGSKGVTTR